MHDARCAFRSMRRFPVATVVAIASLAAGIGATAATLTIRNAVFRNAPPLYRDPDQLSRLRVGRPDRGPQLIGRPPAALYERWRQVLGANVAAAATTDAPSDIRSDDRTIALPVRGITGGPFSLLGVPAELGDTSPLDRFTGEGALPAVLSYRAWDRLFDKSTDVLGKTLWLDNQPHVVVAVMPERFWLSDMESPVWKPLDLRTAPCARTVGCHRQAPDGHNARAPRCAAEGSNRVVCGRGAR